MNNCQNVFCQAWEKRPDTGNCQCHFGFDRGDCEKRKMFNRFMKVESNMMRNFIMKAKIEHD